MLIACRNCHRQYAAGGRPPGSRVRCICGSVISVPEARVHDAPMQRCTACGARLQDGARRCEYCSSEVTMGERGWGEACPECFARLVKGAAFCGSCGTRIEPHTLRKAEGDETCPRCETALTICEVPGAEFIECTSCGGVWLEESLFEHAVKDRERSSAIATFFATPKAEESEARQKAIVGDGEREVRYLKCPACSRFMNRKNFARASGVVVDHCRAHGYWLDPNEMEAILAFVESGGLERARLHEIDRQKAELELKRVRADLKPTLGRTGLADPRRMHGARTITVGVDAAFGKSVVGVFAAFLDVLTSKVD